MRKILALCFVLSACGGTAPFASDASDPADMTIGFDLGHDAGQDAGTDSGPACECSAGPCCDGCHFRGADYACNVVSGAYCTGDSLCSGQPRTLNVNTETTYCTGSSSFCSQTPVQTSTVTDCRNPDGGTSTFLTYGRCDPSGVAHCVDGPSCVATY